MFTSKNDGSPQTGKKKLWLSEKKGCHPCYRSTADKRRSHVTIKCRIVDILSEFTRSVLVLRLS